MYHVLLCLYWKMCGRWHFFHPYNIDAVFFFVLLATELDRTTVKHKLGKLLHTRPSSWGSNSDGIPRYCIKLNVCTVIVVYNRNIARFGNSVLRVGVCVVFMQILATGSPSCPVSP